MALITCPDCGKPVSSLAPSCIHCGRPIKNELIEKNPDILAEIANGKRISCQDGLCTGIIGKDGTCKTCGRPYLETDQDFLELEKEEKNNSSLVKCPRCYSTQITSQKRGYRLGGASIGCLLLGPAGLLGGFIGSGKIKLTCLSCGYSWNVETQRVCSSCGHKNSEKDMLCASCGKFLI